MNNFNLGISPQVQSELNKAYKRNQEIFNAAQIQNLSTAEQIAKLLYKRILLFQESLPNSEDVAIAIVQFNQVNTILVESIGYSGYTLIVFHGKDNNGNPTELIQHISQLNFLLVAANLEPKASKRQIGFSKFD